MKKLVLNERESQELLESGSVEIERNGYPMLIESNPYFDESQEEDCFNRRYDVTIINCFEKVVVKRG